jgi:hypothetical protein
MVSPHKSECDMTIKIVIPSNEALLGYDMASLEKSVERHKENINTFQEAIADERVRIASYESMIARKRELEERAE